MTERNFPADNFWNNPEIDFFMMPDYIANQYYAQINGYENVLLDYYVEAVDVFGNVKKISYSACFCGRWQRFIGKSCLMGTTIAAYRRFANNLLQ